MKEAIGKYSLKFSEENKFNNFKFKRKIRNFKKKFGLLLNKISEQN
jgi:hypothetical protein